MEMRGDRVWFHLIFFSGNEGWERGIRFGLWGGWSGVAAVELPCRPLSLKRCFDALFAVGEDL